MIGSLLVIVLAVLVIVILVLRGVVKSPILHRDNLGFDNALYDAKGDVNLSYGVGKP